MAAVAGPIVRPGGAYAENLCQRTIMGIGPRHVTGSIVRQFNRNGIVISQPFAVPVKRKKELANQTPRPMVRRRLNVLRLKKALYNSQYVHIIVRFDTGDSESDTTYAPHVRLRKTDTRNS